MNTAKPSRIEWWINHLRSGQINQDAAERLLPDFPLQREFARDLPNEPADLNILDIFSGPLTQLGNRHPERRVNIWQLEAQADRLAAVLDELQLTSRGELVAGSPKDVPHLWPEPIFDLVVCKQAGLLRDPIEEVPALLAPVQPGGRLVLTVGFGEQPGSAPWTLQLTSKGLVIQTTEKEVGLNDLLDADTTEISWQANSDARANTCGWITISIRRRASLSDEIRRELCDFATTSAALEAIYGIKLEHGDLDFIADFFSRKPENTAGSILPNDAAFILAWMKLVMPSRVLEIGVSSGVSSAFMLEAARHLDLLDKGFRLDALDLLTHVYTGPRKPVGWCVELLSAELSELYSLTTGVTSEDISSLLKAGKIAMPDMVFLDAEHAHPAPATDIGNLCKVLPADRWILLHDISLFERAMRDGFRMKTRPDWMLRGVQWAFELYPGEKFRGAGEFSNVGAIRVLDDVAGTPAWRTLQTLPHERNLTAAGWKNSGQ